MPNDVSIQLPKINQPIVKGFQHFIAYYLRRNFHVFAINSRELAGLEIGTNDSLVMYANHASWWDPLVAMHLSALKFADKKMYAPIDAEALQKYGMFRQMGFYPIDAKSRDSCRAFVEQSRAILNTPGSSIWLTPEGRFADVRDTTPLLAPGIAHLAAKMASERQSSGKASHEIWFISAGVEYPFWEEKRPEVLIWFGQPISLTSLMERTGGSLAETKSNFNLELTRRLRNAQSQLAVASIARATEPFEVQWGSSGGSFFLYDWWRKLNRAVRGETFSTEHGTNWASAQREQKR